ncbi:MAG: hypothetical protein JOZ85_07130 [Betaproteobacteria bacterium]|nr:hypothetical protein [Betaproteobacteria bacterium]
MKILFKPLQRGFVRSVLVIAAACVAMIAAAWLVVIERIAYEEEDAISDAVRHDANLVLAFEQQAIRALQSVDQTLRLRRAE